MLVAGQTGLTINCMSFVDCFRISITSDEGVFSNANTHQLCDLIEKNITHEILMLKNTNQIQEVKKEK